MVLRSRWEYHSSRAPFEGAGYPFAILRRGSPCSLYPLEPAESGTISEGPGLDRGAPGSSDSWHSWGQGDRPCGAPRHRVRAGGGNGQTCHFDALTMSDGTVRSLGILLSLRQTPRPSIVLLDEIEDLLHPDAHGVLLDAINSASDEFPPWSSRRTIRRSSATPRQWGSAFGSSNGTKGRAKSIT